MRHTQRYSQRDMAEGTGLTDSAISRILRYKTLDNVPIGNILKIAEWLEVEPWDLFEISDKEDSE